MGCYLFSVMINGFLPLQCCDYRALSPSVVCLLGFIPISGLVEGLYPDSVLIHLQGCYPQ